MDSFPAFWIIGFVAILFIAASIYARHQAQQRREAFSVLARKLGLRFRSHEDYEIPER